MTLAVDITDGLSNKVHCELQQVMLYLPLSRYTVNQLYITNKMEYFILKVGMPCKEHWPSVTVIIWVQSNFYH